MSERLQDQIFLAQGKHNNTNQEFLLGCNWLDRTGPHRQVFCLLHVLRLLFPHLVDPCPRPLPPLLQLEKQKTSRRTGYLLGFVTSRSNFILLCRSADKHPNQRHARRRKKKMKMRRKRRNHWRNHWILCRRRCWSSRRVPAWSPRTARESGTWFTSRKNS